MSDPHTPNEVHGIHQDEAIRDRREKRAIARAIADERALAGRRTDALLAYDPSVAISEDLTGFAPGGYV